MTVAEFKQFLIDNRISDDTRIVAKGRDTNLYSAKAYCSKVVGEMYEYLDEKYTPIKPGESIEPVVLIM